MATRPLALSRRRTTHALLAATAMAALALSMLLAGPATAHHTKEHQQGGGGSPSDLEQRITELEEQVDLLREDVDDLWGAVERIDELEARIATLETVPALASELFIEDSSLSMRVQGARLMAGSFVTVQTYFIDISGSTVTADWIAVASQAVEDDGTIDWVTTLDDWCFQQLGSPPQFRAVGTTAWDHPITSETVSPDSC